LDATVDIALALDAACVDVIELGIPFSDPLADGPSIQAAGHRALLGGATVARALDTLREIRSRSAIPIVLMTYFNPALSYGLDRFARDVAGAGADGVIQTDLTPEEADLWIPAARGAGLDTVFLLAPTSTESRIDVVTGIATGFIYCVSRTGVTGARDEIPMELEEFVGRVRRKTDLPVCVGFGISTSDHVRRITAFSDGVVVGSALVDLIATTNRSDLGAKVKQFAEGLRA